MQKNYLLPAIVCTALMLFNPFAEARPFSGRTIQMPLQKIAPGSGKIQINFKLPANHEFAPEAPSTIFARTKHPAVLKVMHAKPVALPLDSLPYSLAYRSHTGNTVAVIDMRVHFCDENVKVCLVDFIRLKFPVQIESGAPVLTLNIPLKSKIGA